MRPLRNLLDDGCRDGRVCVAHEQRAVAHHVVDVLVAIDVPLAAAGGALDEDRKRRHVTDVVGHAGWEDARRVLVEARGLRVQPNVRVEDGVGHRGAIVAREARQIGGPLFAMPRRYGYSTSPAIRARSSAATYCVLPLRTLLDAALHPDQRKRRAAGIPDFDVGVCAACQVAGRPAALDDRGVAPRDGDLADAVDAGQPNAGVRLGREREGRVARAEVKEGVRGDAPVASYADESVCTSGCIVTQRLRGPTIEGAICATASSNISFETRGSSER